MLKKKILIKPTWTNIGAYDNYCIIEKNNKKYINMLYNTDLEQKVYDRKHQNILVRLLEDHEIVLEEWNKVIGLKTSIRHGILEAKCFISRQKDSKNKNIAYGLKIINENTTHIFSKMGCEDD